ncbi:hypothetical protein CR532_04900 (plasmid) [Candidatus Borreliella tachyglossi]|uniref:Uncharacterized protein n=1 Tax=Candidatus Borreliella tachyglossi TaxID=1964448 RepID=A0A2S1LYH3_9SPIR|nr:plasmid maintenance protein [Candidatus Borreliella tachyglossi]AWG43339.1 hypothetical protein CR532_04900 [Candidatus Borreliella tachyglossi]
MKKFNQVHFEQFPEKKAHNRLFKTISTINYLNTTLKPYQQQDILYLVNHHLSRDGLKPVKLRTLRKDLTYLVNNKIIKKELIRLGEYKGSYINYTTTKYSIINLKALLCLDQEVIKRSVQAKYKFRKETQERYYKKQNNSLKQNNPKKFENKNATKNEGVYIINNNNITKEEPQESVTSKKPTKLQLKQNELAKIISFSFSDLEKEGYNKQQLDIEKEKLYETYKLKPHFIIEHTKYNDLELKVKKLKKILPLEVKEVKEQQQKELGNNIFSILVSQFENKIDRNELKPYLNEYLKTQGELTFSKIYNNTYYNELRNLLETNNKIATLVDNIPSYLRRYHDTSNGECK